MKSGKSGIYRIKNLLNGKRYIGSSGDVESRWSQHLSALLKNQHSNGHLQAAWNKYGTKNFEFSVVVFCEVGVLIKQEQALLDAGMGEYNIARDAIAPWRGVKRSPETCAKISAAQVGTKQSPETVAKRIAKTTGQTRNLEQIARIKAATINHRPSVLALANAHAKTREIATKVVMTTIAGSTHFDSMSDAVNAGYHSTSIRRAIKLRQEYKAATWTIETAKVTATQAHGREVGVQTLRAVNLARRRPIEATSHDGVVTRFESMNAAMQTGCNNTRIVRAIKEHRLYRGKTWRYASEGKP